MHSTGSSWLALLYRILCQVSFLKLSLLDSSEPLNRIFYKDQGGQRCWTGKQLFTGKCTGKKPLLALYWEIHWDIIITTFPKDDNLLCRSFMLSAMQSFWWCICFTTGPFCSIWFYFLYIDNFIAAEVTWRL